MIRRRDIGDVKWDGSSSGLSNRKKINGGGGARQRFRVLCIRPIEMKQRQKNAEDGPSNGTLPKASRARQTGLTARSRLDSRQVSKVCYKVYTCQSEASLTFSLASTLALYSTDVVARVMHFAVTMDHFC